MQLSTVLTLRHFSDFTEHARAFIPTVKPINYRAWTTTLCFAHRGFTRAESARRPDNDYERNQFAIYWKGDYARKCILHRVSCHVPRPDAHEMKGVSWDGVLTLRRGEKHPEEAWTSRVTHRKKKEAFAGCTSRILNAGANVEWRASVSYRFFRFTGDLPLITLILFSCAESICRIAKPRNYAASCWGESLEGIHER